MDNFTNDSWCTGMYVNIHQYPRRNTICPMWLCTLWNSQKYPGTNECVHCQCPRRYMPAHLNIQLHSVKCYWSATLLWPCPVSVFSWNADVHFYCRWKILSHFWMLNTRGLHVYLSKLSFKLYTLHWNRIHTLDHETDKELWLKRNN